MKDRAKIKWSEKQRNKVNEEVMGDEEVKNEERNKAKHGMMKLQQL
jgi:hypothetical protein